MAQLFCHPLVAVSMIRQPLLVWMANWGLEPQSVWGLGSLGTLKKRPESPSWDVGPLFFPCGHVGGSNIRNPQERSRHEQRLKSTTLELTSLAILGNGSKSRRL